MNPNVLPLIALQRQYPGQLLIVTGEPTSSIVFDAVVNAGKGVESEPAQFDTHDDYLPVFVKDQLDKGYCVGILPAGQFDVLVFSGPNLHFPGVSRTPHGHGEATPAPPPRRDPATFPAPVRRSDPPSEGEHDQSLEGDDVEEQPKPSAWHRNPTILGVIAVAVLLGIVMAVTGGHPFSKRGHSAVDVDRYHRITPGASVASITSKTTVDDLRSTYGAAQVTLAEVWCMGCTSTASAAIVKDRDAETLTAYLNNTTVESVCLSSPRYVAPNGLRVGLPLREVADLLGPFRVSGLDGDGSDKIMIYGEKSLERPGRGFRFEFVTDWADVEKHKLSEELTDDGKWGPNWSQFSTSDRRIQALDLTLGTLCVEF